jgi:hypothetical protein
MSQFVAFCSNGRCVLHQPASGKEPPPPGGGDGEVSITGSVGVGGRNTPADVKAIQAALNDIPPSDGGPDPKLAVDGIAGPKTNKAIAKFQQRNIGWSDGRIDPGGPTLKAINARRALQPLWAAAAPKAPILPAADKEEQDRFIRLIGYRLPDAMLWTRAALRVLEVAADLHRSTNGGQHSLMGEFAVGLVEKYFHIHQITTREGRIAYIEILHRTFRNIQQAINECQVMQAVNGWGVGYFQPDPQDGKEGSEKYNAYTYAGGWHSESGVRKGMPRMSREDNDEGPNLRKDGIYFPVSHWPPGRFDREFLVLVMLHELAHFVSAPFGYEKIMDYANFEDAGFANASVHQTRRSADPHARFAAEAYLRREPRTHPLGLHPYPDG